MDLELNLDRVRRNVAKAATEDLLDRATVFRNGMEPAALEVIDGELRKRGVTAEMIRDHWENRRSNALVRNPAAQRCSFCDRPAIVMRWGWHRLWGKIPICPWKHAYCDLHAPK